MIKANESGFWLSILVEMICKAENNGDKCGNKPA